MSKSVDPQQPKESTVEVGRCVVCGCEASFRFDDTIITPQLRNAWGITGETADAFNRRESMFCSVCRSSLRVRRLCDALLQTYSEMSGKIYGSFAEVLNDTEFRKLRIAEINACGAFHHYLKQHPNLCYSEYIPNIPLGSEHNGIRCEDLQALTYPDDYFDIVLTSDTLEHVPNPDKAWAEIHRTLKPGGYHIFTIPVVPTQRVTRRRASLIDGHTEYMIEPAYHGRGWGTEDLLVYTDFGMDVLDRLNELGLSTDVLYREQHDPQDLAFVFRSFKHNVTGVSRMMQPKLEWTGERFLPWIEGAQIHYEHLHRYAFATSFVKGKKILDLACGEGYGPYMLSKEAESVIGIEIDEQTVNHAKSRYSRDNLEFIQGSVLEIPIGGERKFDVIVCFEAIEHIGEHDKLLSEVKRLLKEDGLFIVSTPNKEVYTEDHDYQNPFHVKELYLDQFKQLLRSYFKNVHLLGQRMYAGSNLWDISSREYSSHKEFVMEKGEKEFSLSKSNVKTPRYFIAVGSDADLKPFISSINSSWLVDVSDTLFKDYQKQIQAKDTRVTELNSALQDKESEVTELNSTLQDKESEVTELNSTLQDKESEVTELNSALQDKESEVTELNSALQTKESEVTELNSALQTKESQVTELNFALQDKESQVAELNSAVQDKESEVTELNSALQTKESQVTELNFALQDKESQVAELNSAVQEKESEVTELNSALQAKDGRISELNKTLQSKDSRIRELEIQIQLIQRSILIQLSRRYHKLVDKLLRHGTKRRNYYDLGLAGIRVLLNEGWRSLWRKYKRYRCRDKIVPNRVDPSYISILSVKTEERVDIIDKSVTVVIPTKNAGQDFDFTLERIVNAKGVKTIQTVVVDSGSTDSTVSIAEKYGARVFVTTPDEFNHGLTRNFGAAQGSGDYVLFMVQDAIPIGDYFLHDMLSVLESERAIAAATCRQIPRSDADLFACFNLWNHYRLLGFPVDIVYSGHSKFHELQPLEKRRIAGLDDVCCLIRKRVFDNLKFKELSYAEDLDLGLRLVERKYKIAFLRSVGVIHSHNREASYLLKRSYVESKLLPGMLSYKTMDYPMAGQRIIEVFAGIMTLYAALNASAIMLNSFSEHPRAVLSELRLLLQSNLSDTNKLDNYRKAGDQLDKVFDTIRGVVGTMKTTPNDFLLRSYLNSLGDLDLYLESRNTLSIKKEEFRDSLYKLFAVVAGSVMASCYMLGSKQKSDDNLLLTLDAILSEGV